MKRFLYIALIILCVGCNHSVLTSHYETIPDGGWNADSTLVFPFEITDSLAMYDIIMNVRHTDAYPYQNIWLFTRLYADTICLQSDTLEFYLADSRGRWLGNGFGRLHDMPMMQRHNVGFEVPGCYRLEVQQAMREDVLCGISDFGVTVQLAE